MNQNHRSTENLVIVHATKPYADPNEVGMSAESVLPIVNLYKNIAEEVRARVSQQQDIYYLGDGEVDLQDENTIPTAFHDLVPRLKMVGQNFRLREFLECKRRLMLAEGAPDQIVYIVGLSRLNCVANFHGLMIGKYESDESTDPITFDNYFYAANRMSWSTEEFLTVLMTKLHAVIIESLTDEPQE